MSQPYAAAVSATQPLKRQENRSGPNFQFVSLPKSGDLTVTFTSASADSLDCTIMEDKNDDRDPVVITIRNGSTVPVGKFNTNRKYYLASPNGAGSTNFEVSFMD